MKNIVLLITDTFRYDNLGERARRPIRTPMLDKFEAEPRNGYRQILYEQFPAGSAPNRYYDGIRRVAPLPVAAN